MCSDESRDKLGGSESPGCGTIVLHASAVALNGRGVLILGASGSGKSGLALRLMAHGAGLIADDRVALRRKGKVLNAAMPPGLPRLVEARGIGLLGAGPSVEAPVALAVDLDRAPLARLPQRETITLLGIGIELILGRGVPNIDAALTVFMKNGAVPYQ